MTAELEAKNGQTVAELLGSLGRETGQLFRQELRLASSEMTAKSARLARGVGVVLAGGALAHVGVVGLMVAIVAGVSPFVPIWLSALVLGAIVAVTGYAVVRRGLATLRNVDPVPRETVREIQADAAWAKESLR